MKTSLAKMAEAAGCENDRMFRKDTAAAVKDALASDRMTIIVSKCESANIMPVIDLDAPVIRHRFMEEVASRNS